MKFVLIIFTVLLSLNTSATSCKDVFEKLELIREEVNIQNSYLFPFIVGRKIYAPKFLTRLTKEGFPSVKLGFVEVKDFKEINQNLESIRERIFQVGRVVLNEKQDPFSLLLLADLIFYMFKTKALNEFIRQDLLPEHSLAHYDAVTFKLNESKGTLDIVLTDLATEKGTLTHIENLSVGEIETIKQLPQPSSDLNIEKNLYERVRQLIETHPSFFENPNGPSSIH